MLEIKKLPGQKVLEIGGGDHPNPSSDCNVDVRPGPRVDVVVDLNKGELPFQDNEWDGVFSQFALEHISYRSIRKLLKDIYRVLKIGGRFIAIVPNTTAQMEWINNHPDGWDGRDFFDSASCILFGDQDYPENSHRSFWNHSIAIQLFTEAGFHNVLTTPFGARSTDMIIDAIKPATIPPKITQVPLERIQEAVNAASVPVTIPSATPQPQSNYDPVSWFDQNYFDGGRKVGGYVNEIYRDFPTNSVIYENLKKHARNVDSVLELGCAKGFILKRYQDDGVRACGLEVSKHCYLSRACNGILQWDITKTPWPWKSEEFDLCYSLNVLEHIPEHLLEDVVREMQRVSRRYLHVVDPKENENDRTRITVRPVGWWESKILELLSHVGKTRSDLQIIDKEEIIRGEFPRKLLEDGGKVKLNLGSFTVMFHYGWNNIDILNMNDFAMMNGYRFIHHDLKQNLPFNTESVDLIYTSHALEHFSYRDCLMILRDCRRVLKPNGTMRIIVPDANYLTRAYLEGKLGELDEINGGASSASNQIRKMWELLCGEHKSAYDSSAMIEHLREAGFDAHVGAFRQCIDHPGSKQILRETLDMFPTHSLYVDAIPKVG